MKAKPEEKNQPSWLVSACRFALALALGYLVWRARFFFEDADTFRRPIPLAYFALECIAFLHAALFWNRMLGPRFLGFRPYLAPAERPPSIADDAVDIFIPTVDEAREVLEPTIRGCLGIAHAKKRIHVLDDGHRHWVKVLAADYGVEYHSNQGASPSRGGNLNFGLARTDAPWVLFLDADTVPQPDVLNLASRHFADERVAVVQFAQEYYNLDSFQHRLHGPALALDWKPQAHWQEQTLFFHAVTRGQSLWGAATWSGSPSLARRTALTSVGGLALGTAHEHLHTSVKLHQQGWKVAVESEPGAFGLAPDQFSAFGFQRRRWSQGWGELFRSKDSPLVCAGLPFSVRFQYLSSFFGHVLSSWGRLSTLALLPVALVLGLSPFPDHAERLVCATAAFFALLFCARHALSHGKRLWISSEIMAILSATPIALGTLACFGIRLQRFGVTPKRRNVQESLRGNFFRAKIIVGLFLLNAIAPVLAFAVSKVETAWWEPVRLALSAWCLYQSTVLLLTIRHIWKKSVPSRHARLFGRLHASLAWNETDALGQKLPLDAPALLEGLSVDGLKIQISHWADFHRGQRVSVRFELMNRKVQILVAVQSVHRKFEEGGESQLRPGERVETSAVHCRIVEMSAEDREHYLHFLFIDFPRAIWRGQSPEKARAVVERPELLTAPRRARAA